MRERERTVLAATSEIQSEVDDETVNVRRFNCQTAKAPPSLFFERRGIRLHSIPPRNEGKRGAGRRTIVRASRSSAWRMRKTKTPGVFITRRAFRRPTLLRLFCACGPCCAGAVFTRRPQPTPARTLPPRPHTAGDRACETLPPDRTLLRYLTPLDSVPSRTGHLYNPIYGNICQEISRSGPCPVVIARPRVLPSASPRTGSGGRSSD